MPFRTDYPLYPDTLIEGLLVDSIPHDIITLSNNAAGVKQVSTVTIGTATDSTVYSIVVDGVTVSVNSGTSATATTIRDSLIAAIKQTALVYNKLIPTGGSGTVVLTARKEGTPGGFTATISGGGAGYAIASTTAAADPSVIAFGRAVTTSSTEAANTCRQINAALSASNILRGVTSRTNAFETQGMGYAIVEGYPPKEAVNVVRRGRVAVRVQETVTPLSAVWAYHTGTYQGTFRATTDSNASQITAGANWHRGASAGGLAVLELNLP